MQHLKYICNIAIFVTQYVSVSTGLDKEEQAFLQQLQEASMRFLKS